MILSLKDQIDYCKQCLAKGGRDHKQMRAIMESLILIDELNLIPPKVDGKDYQQFVQVYFEFREKRGAEAKMNPAAGKALKEIIIYFLKNKKVNGDVKQALAAWEYVLQRWDTLSEFVRKQVGLPAINKHIEEILEELRNGTTKAKQQHAANERERLRDAIKGGQ